MVKKLLKQELLYYAKSLTVILPIVLVLACSTRFIQFFHIDHPIYYMIFSLSVIMLAFSSGVCLLSVVILAVVRFYKNMYTAEGYLTFALPVNNHQHIISKLISYFICFVGAVFTVIIAWLIAFAGVKEVWAVILDIILSIWDNVYLGHLLLFGFEIFILLVISIFISPLTYYACISVGQLAKKNRILLAIGAYYALNMIYQIISTALMIIIYILGFAGALNWIGDFIVAYPLASLHILLWISIIVTIGTGVIFYVVTHRIMTHKLNLE